MAGHKLRTMGAKLGPPRQIKIRLPAKKVDGFYQSQEWRALMDAIIKKRGRRCEDPDHDPKQSRTDRRIYGDHIRELRDGGAPLDEANVMLRCASCHTRKTVAERAKRSRGEGLP